MQVTFHEKSTKKEKIPDNSYLVFLHVRSLYTSVPNSKGALAVKTSLVNFPRRTIATKVITTFLSFFLTAQNLKLFR